MLELSYIHCMLNRIMCWGLIMYDGYMCCITLYLCVKIILIFMVLIVGINSSANVKLNVKGVSWCQWKVRLHWHSTGTVYTDFMPVQHQRAGAVQIPSYLRRLYISSAAGTVCELRFHWDSGMTTGGHRNLMTKCKWRTTVLGAGVEGNWRQTLDPCIPVISYFNLYVMFTSSSCTDLFVDHRH